MTTEQDNTLIVKGTEHPEEFDHSKQDEELLLTPGEKLIMLKECRHKGETLIPKLLDEITKAQLAKAKPIIEKAERERICNEVERYFKYLKDEKPPIIIAGTFELKAWWQALKGD